MQVIMHWVFSDSCPTEGGSSSEHFSDLRVVVKSMSRMSMIAGRWNISFLLSSY